VGGGIGAVALVAVGVLLIRGSLNEPPGPGTAPEQAAQAPAQPAQTPVEVPQAPAESTPPQTAAARDSIPPAPAEPAAPPAPISAPTSAQPRWASTWVNVREARDPEAPVVRVLTPGESVAVADYQSGWWVVYVQNQRVGYAANSLLLSEPPDSTRQRGNP